MSVNVLECVCFFVLWLGWQFVSTSCYVGGESGGIDWMDPTLTDRQLASSSQGVTILLHVFANTIHTLPLG